jgi:ribonuclease HIII
MRWNWSEASGIQSKQDQRTKLLNLGFPNQNVEPRYQQITLDPEERNNKYNKFFQMQRMRVWIHQDAWFHLGKFDKGDHNL